MSDPPTLSQFYYEVFASCLSVVISHSVSLFVQARLIRKNLHNYHFQSEVKRIKTTQQAYDERQEEISHYKHDHLNRLMFYGIDAEDFLNSESGPTGSERTSAAEADGDSTEEEGDPLNTTRDLMKIKVTEPESPKKATPEKKSPEKSHDAYSLDHIRTKLDLLQDFDRYKDLLKKKREKREALEKKKQEEEELFYKTISPPRPISGLFASVPFLLL